MELFRERISTVQRPRSEKAGQDKMISIVMISDGGDDQCNTVQCRAVQRPRSEEAAKIVAMIYYAEAL